MFLPHKIAATLLLLLCFSPIGTDGFAGVFLGILKHSVPRPVATQATQLTHPLLSSSGKMPGFGLRCADPQGGGESDPDASTPTKQTTGFGKLWKGLIGEVNQDMRRYDEDGKKTLQASPAQIVLMVISFYGVPIAIINIYKAIKARLN
mmetsp:Transcript_19067/g.29776  ORF Transcript_19067/g.29776 Transcript_19067/m.29776 type:complete len:149 (+) Transcript_19067:225-671(+)